MSRGLAGASCDCKRELESAIRRAIVPAVPDVLSVSEVKRATVRLPHEPPCPLFPRSIAVGSAGSEAIIRPDGPFDAASCLTISAVDRPASPHNVRCERTGGVVFGILTIQDEIERLRFSAVAIVRVDGGRLATSVTTHLLRSQQPRLAHCINDFTVHLVMDGDVSAAPWAQHCR
eukprot:CAMPEP_0174728514 /NCGR_PEP_ID=MMETSP1094-20130205/51869_1 /TAXON_ID=156173 /ORGANISM="Chrysochromulina brevifilum, Strain UTEX LB 985" /LENGTH=174 /DNA_ID=CAMNT_0015930453 /DNA_START=90 /DNA_END=614 /DNA_ORIENTATION=-